MAKIKASKDSRRVSASLLCGACSGTGHRRRIAIHSNQKKSQLRPFRPNTAWKAEGPAAAYSITDKSIAPGKGEILCSVAGHWCLYQLEKGHRFTTDDILTAYVAAKSVLENHLHPKSYLDLGTGLGSVLMSVLWKLFDSLDIVAGVEAQSVHLELAKRSLAFNGCLEKCRLEHGDLRDLDHLQTLFGTSQFDLLTGTPPYFPHNEGVLPTNSARGMCSFELRGGIEVYFEAASKMLATQPNARLILCQTSIEIKRTEMAARKSGFAVLERWDVYGKQGKKSPLFSIFCCAWKELSLEGSKIIDFYVRTASGSYTPEMLEMMSSMGKPVPRDHTINSIH